jgi:hypothetical protein
MMIIHFIHKKEEYCLYDTVLFLFSDTKKVVDLPTMINECYDIVLN